MTGNELLVGHKIAQPVAVAVQQFCQAVAVDDNALHLQLREPWKGTMDPLYPIAQIEDHFLANFLLGVFRGGLARPQENCGR